VDIHIIEMQDRRESFLEFVHSHPWRNNWRKVKDKEY